MRLQARQCQSLLPKQRTPRVATTLVLWVVVAVASLCSNFARATAEEKDGEESCWVDNMNTCTTSTSTPQTPTNECQLYLAPSTIPGAGLGVFTAIEQTAGTTLRGRYGGADICWPYIDLYWHHDDDAAMASGSHLDHNPLADYFWMGRRMGMGFESNHGDTEALCPGLDCLVNGHALANLGPAEAIVDDDGASSGSTSPYHTAPSHVLQDIPAGGELFKLYGDNWFRERQEALGGGIPLQRHYAAGQHLLDQLFRLVRSIRNTTETKKSAQEHYHHESWLADLYSIVLLQQQQSTANNTTRSNSLVLQTLPSTLSQAQLAHEKGLQAALAQHHRRPLSWLQQHGVCMDHIQRHPTPPSGWGARATRFLPAGTVVTLSPLHHFVGPIMDQYNVTESPYYPGTFYRFRDQVVSQQM